MAVYEDAWSDGPRPARGWTAWAALVTAGVACVLAAGAFWREQAAIDAGQAAELHAQRVEHQLALIQGDAARTDAKVRSTEAAVRARSGSVAPLASRMLQSVFTVETSTKLGSAFLAWQNAGGSYLLTANHVVAGAGGTVTLTRKGGSWSADVVGRDPVNDLALLRADGHPAQARPLWQSGHVRIPRAGEQLLLIGSPYGLGGTVTTGIISRVWPKLLQTDAAANPGNSGGPAIDRGGHVVGILVMGGAQNLNFAVRIDRACIHLRRCPKR